MLVSHLPVYDAPNYAPIKPLLELRERSRTAPSDITSQIKHLYRELDRRDEEVFFTIAETAYTISSFIQGKQFWQRNWFAGGRWELVPLKSDPNKISSINIMQFQVSQMLEDIISSNPDFEPEDMFRSYRFADQVKASKAVWNYYEKRFYTPWFNIQQGLGLITAGTVIEEVCYDASAKAFEVFREIWDEVPVTVEEGYAECFACGTSAAYEDFHRWENPSDQREAAEMAESGVTTALAGLPQCPNCGSFEVDSAAPVIENVPSIVGLESHTLGDLKLLDIPIQAVRFDVAKRPEESPYFIDKQIIPASKINRLFGNLELGTGFNYDRGLEYLYKMSRVGAGIGGAKRAVDQELSADQSKNHLLSRMSLDLDFCAEIEIPHSSDEKMTVEGVELEGKTLADIPEIQEAGGATIIGFNDMSVIYGIYPQFHQKKVSSARYFSKAHSGTGRGAEDLTEIQKRRNRLDAQQVKAVDGAAPGYAFVDKAIDTKDVKMIGFPNARIPVSQAAWNAAGKNINNIIQQFQPQQVAPQLFAYSNDIERFAQMTAHNVSMSDTVFGADNSTATGARILEQAAQAITIPFLQSKAGMRKGTVRNTLHTYKENFSSVTREFSLGISTSNTHEAITVDGEDVNPEIDFVVVSDSEIPQNFYVRKMDYLSFTQAVGGLQAIMGLSEVNPRLLRAYERAFNVDLGLNNFDRIEDVCRRRMEQAFVLLEMFQAAFEELPQNPLTDQPITSNIQPNAGMNDGYSVMNEAGPSPEQEIQIIDLIFEQLQPRILPKEKNHQAKHDWFCDFLDSEDGLALDEDKRRIVVELAIRHELMQQVANNAGLMMAENFGLMSELPNMAIQQKLMQMASQTMPVEEDAGQSPKTPTGSAATAGSSADA